MKRPAKKKVSNNILAAIGAGVLGILAGAAAMFMSEKENREKVQKSVSSAVKKGKVEVAKVKKTVVATKKKILKRR